MSGGSVKEAALLRSMPTRSALCCAIILPLQFSFRARSPQISLTIWPSWSNPDQVSKSQKKTTTAPDQRTTTTIPCLCHRAQPNPNSQTRWKIRCRATPRASRTCAVKYSPDCCRAGQGAGLNMGKCSKDARGGCHLLGGGRHIRRRLAKLFGRIRVNNFWLNSKLVEIAQIWRNLGEATRVIR